MNDATRPRKSLNPDPAQPDVFIVTVPFWGVKMPPLGAAYVASAVQAAGYLPRMVDLNVECYDHVKGDPAFEHLWDTNPPDMTASQATEKVFQASLPVVDRLIDALGSSGAPIVGFSLNYRNLEFGNRVARRIKERVAGVHVLFGGPESYAQLRLGTLWKNEADSYVVGEGEETLVDVLDAMAAKRSLDGIAGVVYRKEGILMSSYTPRKPVMKLDRLPYPTYEGLPLELYSTERLPMLISRGCVCHCRFCVDYILNAPYRFRSPEAVVEEMKFHLEHNGSGEFAFNDLLCNGNMKQLEKLCDQIIEQELPVRWDSYAIVRKEMTPHILQKMRKAGCHNLCYGTESGSDRVLKLMGKFSASAVSVQNIKDTHEAGIRTSINIIVGYPGETEEDFQETLKFVDHCAPWIDEVTNISSLVVMPGTYIADNIKQYGIEYIDAADSWVDDKGSTPDARGDRVKRLIELVRARKLDTEIINHDKLRAKHIMMTVVLPCEARVPERSAYGDLTSYPFQLVIAGGEEGAAAVDAVRVKQVPRASQSSLAACVNEAVRLADGRYVWLAPTGVVPERELLFEMFRSMERATEVHLALPRGPSSGSGIFLRKTAFIEVGGIDESFAPDAGYVDFLIRAHLWGYISATVLEARAGGASRVRVTAQAARNALDVVLRNYSSLFLKEHGIRVARRLLGRMLPSLRDPLSPLHHLAGYYQSLADFPRTLVERRRILAQMTVSDPQAAHFLRAFEAMEGGKSGK